MKYEHEQDRPSQPKGASPHEGMGCDDFKSEADDIAFGQAGKAGVKSDHSKIKSQFKHYGWD